MKTTDIRYAEYTRLLFAPNIRTLSPVYTKITNRMYHPLNYPKPLAAISHNTSLAIVSGREFFGFGTAETNILEFPNSNFIINRSH